MKKLLSALLVLALMFCCMSQVYALEEGDKWADDMGVEYSVRYVRPEDQRIEYPEPVEPLRKASGEGTNELTNGADWYGLTWSEDGSDSIGVYVYHTDSDGNVPKINDRYRVKKAAVSNCYDPPKTASLYELPNGDLFVEVYGCTNSSSAFDTENENFDLAFTLLRPTESSFEVLKSFSYNTYRCAGQYVDSAEGAEVDFKSEALLGGHRDDLALETVAKIAEQFFADENICISPDGAYVESIDSSYEVPMPSLNINGKDDKEDKKDKKNNEENKIVNIVSVKKLRDLPELFSLYN